jgi:2-polyprenyl-3-methyl-5-hydroxy-6-metoxy-1,4-benzoquinol methylase
MNYRKTLLKKYVSTGYSSQHSTERMIEDYRKNKTFFKYNYLDLIPNNKNVNILEVGVGFGQFMKFLKDYRYKSVSGVDASSEVVEFCINENLNVTLAEDFVEFFKNINDKYDVIIANDILEHFTKDELIDLLTNLKKCLNKGGSIIGKVPNASNIFTGSHSRYIDYTHELSFTETSLRQLFLALGYKPCVIREPKLFVFYKNPLNYIGIFLTRSLKMIQILIHRLNGNFSVHIVSNTILFKFTK